VTRRVLAVGGPPGSGKSTAGRLAAASLDLEFRSAGEEFRRSAAERSMDVDAFGQYAESHPEVDRELDERMLALARPGRLLEGRLTGPLCRRRAIPVDYVVVTASEAERIRRIARRDGRTLEEAGRHLRQREASERVRYATLYRIDLDLETPDLTVDATRPPPEEVARTIVTFVRAREAAGAP